jgi:uncharacterized protein YerC
MLDESAYIDDVSTPMDISGMEDSFREPTMLTQTDRNTKISAS